MFLTHTQKKKHGCTEQLTRALGPFYGAASALGSTLTSPNVPAAFFFICLVCLLLFLMLWLVMILAALQNSSVTRSANSDAIAIISANSD